MAIRIGIDNGANGAIIAIDQSHKVLLALPMPVIDVGVMRKGKRGKKRVLDMVEVVTHLRKLKELDDNIFAVQEHAQVFPGEGRSTAFTAGRGYGAMEMALVALQIPYEIVRARAWQTAVLKGVEGVDTKARSVLKCRRVFPDIDLTPGRRRKPMDGLADGAMMALHALQIRPV